MTTPPIPPPAPLNYRHRGAADDTPKPPFSGPFFAGLLIGCAASFVIWWFGAPALDHSPRVGFIWVLAYVVPIIKVLASLVLFAKAPLRGAGVGVLLSIPVGVLIFIGSCFAH